MESLSKYQYRTLLKLANSPTKLFCCVSGLPNDRDEDVVNLDFNSILRLIELKLVKDVTDANMGVPAYEDCVNQGREVVIVNLTNKGQWMFERTTWEKWVN